MPTRYHDWFSQSKRDIEQALDSQQAGRHEGSCFAAHQAAEKAVKALHQYHNQEAWGHVVRKLLEELPASVSTPDGLLDKARVLDSYYIPTRYANGHPEGAPFEHYGKLQSEEAIKYDSEIIEFCGSQMA